MKKRSYVLISMLLVLSLILCGCGGSETKSETKVPDKPLAMGTIENGVYTNTYAGFGCELGSDWNYYSAEELQQLPDDLQELMGDSEMGEAMQQYQQLFDMQAENLTNLVSMNVVYTKIGMTERMAYALLDEEGVIDATLKQKDMMIEGYTQAGITVQSMEKVKVTFLGEEHYAVYTVAESMGIPCYMLQIQSYNLGAYGVTLTATSFFEDSTADVLGMFYAVE